MNFEKNRRELLEQLSKRRRNKSTQRKAAPSKPAQKVNPGVKLSAEFSKIKKEIILYGKDSLFIRNMTQSLKSTYTILHFDNGDDACKHCLDNNISDVLLDMDAPTDWKMSTDVFTTIKILHPDVKFYLFTKDKRTVQVRTLVAQGGILIPKPVLFEDLYAELNN